MSLPTRSTDWKPLQVYAKIFPNHIPILEQIAEGWYAEGNYPKALKFFEQILEINSKKPLNFGHVGNSYEEGAKDYKRAASFYERALRVLGTHDTWLMQRLGWCYIQSQQYENAIDVFENHCQQVPSDGWSWGKLGYAHQMMKEYQKALQNHLQADKVGTSEHAWNLGNIGYCYQMVGDYNTALNYHLRSEQIDRNDIWNLKNVGYCYQKAANNYSEALAYHQRVYDEDPTDVWNIKNVGYCQQQLGNYEKAIKFFYLVEKILPDDTWNLGNIGYTLQRMSRHKDALQCHQKVYDIDAHDSWNRYQLGYCYFTQYNLEEADFYLQGDDDKYALLHLGSVHLVKGQHYLALEKYKASLEMFGSYYSFIATFNLDRVQLQGDYGVSAQTCDSIAEELETYSQTL